MSDLILILVGTVLVNNFVLVRFLGLCPIMGVSRNVEAAFGMSLATAFVLTLSSAISYLIHQYLLVPLQLEYLRTISFILIIAVSVQFTEIMVRRLSPLLDQVLGIYIPLIATNCAVLGVALLNVQDSSSPFFSGLVRLWVSRWCWSCLRRFANDWTRRIRRARFAVRRSHC